MAGRTATARGIEASADMPPVALAGLRIDARVDGAMTELRIEQTFRNDEDQPIEAVYSFPLPADAALLDVTVEIGDRLLRGNVVPLEAARTSYEDAIADGDGAFLLETPQPGLFTLHAGNLRPGETARVAFAFASLNRWTGDRLRLVVPTTVAPRYGAWPVDPHAVPEASLLAENRCALRLTLGADLEAARLACPSHRLRSADDQGRTVFTLADETASMDRDIVIEVRHPEPRPSFALLGKGIDGVVALASFQPFVPGLATQTPIDAVAVLDCSGSMAGMSIEQARKAMRAVLATLDPRDRLGMLAFGSTTRALAGGRHRATRAGLATLGAFADTLDADLGGTEIAMALDEAIAAAASRRGGRAADIFLVTDGQVADWQPVVERARRSGLRVFAVGVGYATAEPFLATLARATGGAAEFVTPDEAMAERIARHFERMRAPRATDVAIDWPDGATPLAPTLPPALFDGDTIHAFARLPDDAIQGHAALVFTTAQGTCRRQEVALAGPVASGTDALPSTLARLAAAARLADLPEDQATAIAVAHRLLGPNTAWIVTLARAAGDRTDGAPALRKVPHMLTAGWGGTGAAIRLAEATMSGLSGCSQPGPYDPAQTHASRRRAIAALLASAADLPPPGAIAQAVGLADDLEHMRRAAPSAFVAELAGIAFEIGVLEASAGQDAEFAAARARLGALLQNGLARLDGLMRHAAAIEAELSRLLPDARDAWEMLHRAVIGAHRFVDATQARARHLCREMNQPAA